MGRGRGGRGRGGHVVGSLKEIEPPGRGQGEKKGRGRPSSTTGGTSGGASVSASLIQRIERSLPRLPTDGDEVTCAECSETLTYRQFRLHNIKVHMNTAATMEEKQQSLIMDHKYFSRKLNEFKKLTKASMFGCPREGCHSSFKSTLGLAYHMNTCGRSAEELDAVLIQCEECGAKLTLPNMQWHRKVHEEQPPPNTVDSDSPALKQILGSKRKSAIKYVDNSLRAWQFRARKSFKQKGGSSGNLRNQEDDDWESCDDDEDESEKIGSADRLVKSRQDNRNDGSEFCNIAVQFLDSLDTEKKAWDDPPRICDDPFHHIVDNPFQDPTYSNQAVEDFLPASKESVEFKYISQEGSSEYHKLTWFEGETVDSAGTTAVTSLHYTGGHVLSMSWHPSGKLLAIAVGHDFKEEVDAMSQSGRKGCIQIYSCSFSSLSLQLVVGVNWGYATHIQWSNFFPDIMDSYNPSMNNCFEDIEISFRIGYLAIACEDSSVRIMSIRIEDFKLEPNYEYKPEHRIRVYTKESEICLRIHDSVITQEELGNVVKFDWHESNRFLAVGYASGMIAVYDLNTTSPLLVQTHDEIGVMVVNPFWAFAGHHLPVRGICFNPTNPRYLATAGHDRTMKIWDIDMRSERDSKRIGMALDMCWIRGWVHQALSCESHVAYQSAMHNYVRVFQTGNSLGKPTSAELFNFTSLDFYHGLIAQGTDDGKMSVTYYDWFWRDCDYERNRKKKNLVVLCSAKMDPNSYNKVSSADFSVKLKKLSKSVLANKTFQRIYLNEDEGVYSVSLEAKFGGSKIFEPLPNPDSCSDDDETEISEGRDKKLFSEDYTRTSEVDETVTQNKETVDVDETDSVLMEAIDSVQPNHGKDGIVPVFDISIPEDETPKLILSLIKTRPSSLHPTEGFDDTRLEEYVRFQPYIRINKVAFSPSGNVIVVGFRNGLVSLLPASFENIFS